MSMNSNQLQNRRVSVDQAFHAIPKSKPCLLIWRIESMQLMPVPKESYGTFFKGDTYLIYSCNEQGIKTHNQHIHLWIGADSTTDEQGVGAFKMVELDDYLSSSPIQHRECQNFESERFLSYFKNRNGIKYQNGGAASGFQHSEKKADLRLFQLKGKRNVRLIELSNIDWTSLNRTDCFIIDMNSIIFIWNGKNANRFEKLQAINKACAFREEHNGACNIVIVEDGEEKDMSKNELSLFELKLPLKDKMTKLKSDTVNSQMDDMKFERELVTYLKLYKCSEAGDDEDGTVKIKIIEQKTGPLFKEDLNSEDSFIIDNGKAGIWVWIGRKSGFKERQEAMRNALGFLQAKGYDERQQNSIKVTRVIDGCEPIEFKALFNRWSHQNEQKGLGKTHSINKTAKPITSNFDASLLHLNPKLAAETQMVDDGHGFKQIWLVKNFEINEIDEVNYGRFHSQNCYIIRYTYELDNLKKHIIYYWIGHKSTIEDQGTAALKTIEIDHKLFDDQALQVRIVDSKEPIHFMSIFGGRIIIYQDEHNLVKNQYDTIKDYMLQVRAYGNSNIKAVQVDFKASSLNSNDVFVVCSKAQAYYVWYGKGSTGDEREVSKSLVIDMKHEPEIVIESQEKEEFWSVLGGKKPYCNEKRLALTSSQEPIARLFELSNASGKLSVEEIYQFCQADLNPGQVMILDAWNVVFIWIGSDSQHAEVNGSVNIVQDYLRTDPSQRGTEIPIFKIKQGQEPPNFTGFFGPWDPSAFKTELSYMELKSGVQSKNQAHLFETAVREKSKKNYHRSNGAKDFSRVPKYSYDELIKPVEELPESVDNAAREVYLNEEDFRRIFNMTFEQFVEKPSWKQIELKRAVQLF